jgi:methylated-DNA-[protein]-cysteine S-methyltransferase
MTIQALAFDTPVGRIRLVEEDGELTALHLNDEGPVTVPDPLSPLLARARAQLEEYFAGARRDFDLPLAPRGTPFQRAVWRALSAIPFGVTRTYGEIAAVVGKPTASRAVGAANGQNPIAIVVPCHRVIGANGTLTGFGGGLPMKKWLLRHEGVPETRR